MVYSIDIHHLLWGICILRNILGSPSNRCLKMDPAIINQWIPVDISGYQWIKGDIQPQNWRFPEISPCLAASSVGLSHHDSTGEIPMSHHVSVKSHWFHCVLSLCFTYLYISLPIFFPMKLPVSSIVIRPKPWFFSPGKSLLGAQGPPQGYPSSPVHGPPTPKPCSPRECINLRGRFDEVFRWCFPWRILTVLLFVWCSMDPIHKKTLYVSIYTSTMDPMGLISLFLQSLVSDSMMDIWMWGVSKVDSMIWRVFWCFLCEFNKMKTWWHGGIFSKPKSCLGN